MDSGQITSPPQEGRDVLDGQAERIFREAQAAEGSGRALDYLWQAVKARKDRKRRDGRH